MQYIKYRNNYPAGDPVKLEVELPSPLKKAVNLISGYGGEPYLVGGAVIDLLCGEEVKDWDVEVFHFSYDRLTQILSDIGNVDLIGNKFGIVKLKIDDVDMEFSIPRRENSNGLKHQDFDIDLVPDLSIEEAAKRRDFTVNAIYIHLPYGHIIDPYDGLGDLAVGKLTYVNKDTFVEDPLRVFRGLQLIARKLRVSTVGMNDIVKDMIESKDLNNVPHEAIFGEMNKMMLKADSFAYAALYLERTNLLSFFPELDALRGCEQSPKWHPEGDVWTHTCMVMEEAFRYRDELPEGWKLPFMWAMLIHDIGKPSCLGYKEDKITTYGHDKVGGEMAVEFMSKLTNSPEFINKVSAMAGAHMRPRMLAKSKAKIGSWRKLQNICRLDVLAYVSMCDTDGRGMESEGKTGEFKSIMDMWEKLGKPTEKIPPLLMGKHLIERGMTPGVEFGPVLKAAYKYQIKTGQTDIEKLYKAGKHVVKQQKVIE